MKRGTYVVLIWPSAHIGGGDVAEDEQKAIKQSLDAFSDVVSRNLIKLGLAPNASLLWRPWSILVVRDAEKVLCAFTSISGGLPNVDWVDKSTEIWDVPNFARVVGNELGRKADAVVVLPLPNSGNEDAFLEKAALEHVIEVERSSRLGRLGDLAGVQHLEPHLREFLADHPDPERNVFVMMRFHDSKQLDEAHLAIKETLAERGLHAVRADDRDYTGELWSNIEVYLTCSRYGIAIFEDIDRRDFNPNVALELGYMMGRRKRCLILKEQRLPELPSDVIHRLYKPFDMFNVKSSVTREVARWIDVDLAIGTP
jgi:hypothetical protein